MLDWLAAGISCALWGSLGWYVGHKLGSIAHLKHKVWKLERIQLKLMCGRHWFTDQFCTCGQHDDVDNNDNEA